MDQITPPSDSRRQFLQTALSIPVLGMSSGGTAASGFSAIAEPQQDPSLDGLNLVSDTQVDLTVTGADTGSLFPVLNSMSKRHDYSQSYLSGRYTSLEEFRDAGRARLRECFGRQPDKVDLNPEVVDRQDLGDIIREKVFFQSAPDLRVPAYVHLPKAAGNKPRPAIVDLHSHGGMFLFGKEKVIDLGEKRNHPVMADYHQHVYGGRPTATALARRGYVVITIDALMFGERRILMDKDQQYGWDRSRYSVQDARYLNGVCRSKESTLVKSLALAGYTWPGLVTWDDTRTVDYLLTRPEVDPKRIGCVGVSMGGHRSLYLAAMDERIAAACVVGFMSTVRPMIQAHIDTHSFVHFIPLLHQYLDMPDVVSLMAPKPLMVQQCRLDGLYPVDGMNDSVKKIAAVYEKAGAAGRFRGEFFDGPHRFDQPMQNVAFDWFDQQL